MNLQQANPNTIAEFNFYTYGNADSKAVAESIDEDIVNAEARDVTGNESLTTVCAQCNAWRIGSTLDYSVPGRDAHS
jgi:hypothetical protein